MQTKHSDLDVVRNGDEVPKVIEEGKAVAPLDNGYKMNNWDTDARASTAKGSAEPEEDNGSQTRDQGSDRRCCGFECSGRLKWGLIILVVILVLGAIVGGGVTASMQNSDSRRTVYRRTGR